MSTMSLTLPDEMSAFVEAEATRGGYATANDYVQALIREDQRRRAKQQLAAKLREAVASGPATPMTREDWDSIKAEAMERLAADRASG